MKHHCSSNKVLHMKQKSKIIRQLSAGFVLALFSHAISAQDILRKFETNGKYGFKNKSGEIIIPAKYQDAGYFKDGLAAIKQNNKWGFVDDQGREILPPKYDDIGYDNKTGRNFSGGLIPVAVNGKWGYADKNGKTITPIKYQQVTEFSE